MVSRSAQSPATSVAVAAPSTSPARSVFEAVADHAARRPNARALSAANRSWSYAELAAQAEALAARLVALAGRDARVAVVADHHPLTCFVYLACARAGLIVSLVNSRFRAGELAVVLAKLDPQLVVTDAAHHVDVDAALATAGLTPARLSLMPAGFTRSRTGCRGQRSPRRIRTPMPSSRSRGHRGPPPRPRVPC